MHETLTRACRQISRNFDHILSFLKLKAKIVHCKETHGVDFHAETTDNF